MNDIINKNPASLFTTEEKAIIEKLKLRWRDINYNIHMIFISMKQRRLEIVAWNYSRVVHERKSF